MDIIFQFSVHPPLMLTYSTHLIRCALTHHFGLFRSNIQMDCEFSYVYKT